MTSTSTMTDTTIDCFKGSPAAAAVVTLQLRSSEGDSVRAVPVQQVVIASWTGRDHAAIHQRWLELEARGIARPSTAPMFYRIASTRVTTSSILEVIGMQTTGEAEVVLLQLEGRLWVGVGSDHTDRLMETNAASLAKQLCDKPVASEFWAFDDVAPHWDQLRLRSFVTDANGARVPYQDGEVSAMLAPLELLERLSAATDKSPESIDMVLFCGTLPTIGPIRPATRFEFELLDPVLGRMLAHGYEVRSLPGDLAGDRATG